MVVVRKLSIEIERENAKCEDTLGVDTKMAGHEGLVNQIAGRHQAFKAPRAAFPPI